MREDINDNEIRIIGLQQEPSPRRKWWPWLVLALITLAIIITLIILSSKNEQEVTKDDEIKEENCVTEYDAQGQRIDAVFEREETIVQNTYPLKGWICSYDNELSGCAIKDTMVNDVPIRIYLPLNATAALQVGTKCLTDKNTILAFQAADIRADNKKIVGAFVEKGKPLAWGLSKKGFCAIIDSVITIGVADNSPLFEEATEKGGYFFRQYPLVADGKLQYNELRTQSIRRALCDINKRVAVIETQDRTSMHDFSQLLVDIGVDNAIYLIGSEAYGMAIDTLGVKHTSGTYSSKTYKFINYIYWSRSATTTK